MKFLTTLLLFSFLNNVYVFPQNYKSVFQTDYEKYRIIAKQKSFFDETGKDIIPLIENNKGLSKAIYGYLPDWEYLETRNYLNYDLLTHISAFDFTVASDGSISNPSYWPWTDVINAAHIKGVKVILTAVCFVTNDIHNILTNSNVKQFFFLQVKNKISQYNLDGVNIDFENIATADRGAVLNGFMNELTSFIHSYLPGKEVSFAGPAVNWGGWDLNGLVNACDYVFIMGYDFYGSWSSNTGPSAPLVGGNYNITNTVNVQYSLPTLNNPHKLILGVPYFGNKWQTQTLEPGSAVISHIGSTRFKNDVVNSATYGLLWSTYKTVWYRYNENGNNYQVWFDNDSSLGLKFQLAQSKNYKGIGMWALGYDNGRQELWNELRKRFFIPAEVSLLAPNGGEILNAYSEYYIKWNASNSIRVKLEYSTDNGTKWSVIIDSYPSDSLKFKWIVPNTGSNNCLVKISDLSTPGAFDISDSAFKIIPVIPQTPVLLAPSNNSINLLSAFSFYWSNSAGAISYHFQLSRNSDFSNLIIDDSLVTQTIRYVSGLSEGTKYYWRVAAENIAGKSNFSNVFNFTTRLLEPDSLTAINYDLNKIMLNWKDKSSNEKGFGIQRKRSDESQFITIDSVSANIISFLDSTISGNIQYVYRVFSYNDDAISSFSKEATVLSLPSIIIQKDINIPKVLQFRNYPNPFNSETKIELALSKKYDDKNILSLKIYDLLGKEVLKLYEDIPQSTFYSFVWNGNNFNSGIYYCVMKYGNDLRVIKLNMIK